MIIEKLKEYIRKERAKGVDPEVIRSVLLEQGALRTARQMDPFWGVTEVDEAFLEEEARMRKEE